MATEKTIALTIWTFVGKESLLCDMLSRFVIFPSKDQASFNIMAAVTICSDFGVQENKIGHIVLLVNKICFHFFPIYLPWSDGTGCHWSSFFECWVLSQLLHSPLLLSPKSSLVPLHFLPLGRCHLHIWGCWYFSWQSWFQLVIHPAQHFTWCTLHVS